MGLFVQDLRHATRLLVRNPGFSFAATLTLALGIGANTAIFTVVDAVLLRPLPYKDPERLVMLWETEPSAPQGLFPVTWPDFVDWRAHNSVFDGIVAGTSAGATLTGAAEPLKLQGLEISPETFELLGVEPLRGRVFRADETQPGRNHVVILSSGLWQRAFGGDGSIVGRKVTLDGEAYDVVGIMPKGFEFPPIWGSRPEYWVPLDLQQPAWRKDRGNHWLWVMGRLKRGTPIEKARADMETISRRLAQQYPDTNTGVTARLRTLRDQLTGRVKPAFLVLFATAGSLGDD